MPPSSSELLVEKALRLLAQEFPDSAGGKKAALFHSVRVGTRLWRDGYPIETVLGGFLHDVLEDTSVTREKLAEMFGPEVAGIVAANTKDMSVEKTSRGQELIARCAAHSVEAAVIKAADILDNYVNYGQLGDKPEVERARKLAALLAAATAHAEGANIFADLRQVAAE